MKSYLTRTHDLQRNRGEAEFTRASAALDAYSESLGTRCSAVAPGLPQSVALTIRAYDDAAHALPRGAKNPKG